MGPYTCNRDTWVPNGSNYACCPNDQGLSTNENDPVIIAEANGNLNACIVTPSSDLVKPTPTPTQNPTQNPTPDPTPDPTPGPTPEPTPEPTNEPTPDPTPEPTPDPTPNPTPDPTQPPQTNSDENLVDAPDMGSGTTTATTS